MDELLKLITAFHEGDKSTIVPIHDKLLDMGYPHIAEYCCADFDRFGQAPLMFSIYSFMEYPPHLDTLEQDLMLHFYMKYPPKPYTVGKRYENKYVVQ